MWPPGMKDLGISGASGKIPADRTAEPGRALGRLTDVGWGTTLRALLADEAPDRAVTDQLTDAVVKVLAAWDWSQRPAGVVTVPSRTRPVLITSLGQRVAQVGRLPYLGQLGYASPDGPGPRRHTAPSGCARCGPRSPSRTTFARHSASSPVRSCSSMTASRPAGP